MDQLLSSRPNSLSLFVICGDFNCHHASWLGVGTSLTCHGTSAKAFCDSFGLTQSVNFPTWISTNGTPSLLDLILTNFPENICCSSSTPIIWITVESGISLRLTGSDFKQPLNFQNGLQYQLILGIISKKLALSPAQIYPLESSVVLPFLAPMVH